MCAFISHATSFRRKALADSDCSGAAPAPAARASGTSFSETHQGMSAAAYAIGKQPSLFDFFIYFCFIACFIDFIRNSSRRSFCPQAWHKENFFASSFTSLCITIIHNASIFC
jgi:hypothetical protein